VVAGTGRNINTGQESTGRVIDKSMPMEFRIRARDTESSGYQPPSSQSVKEIRLSDEIKKRASTGAS
jgi:hypothetical protein